MTLRAEKLFAIGDLHLEGGQNKPMAVFGPHWENHFEKIKADWLRCVSPCDTVLIPGDISWAMQLKDALFDLVRIGALPGKKILLRGNHDYWWSSITKVRESLPEKMRALQNDAVVLDRCVIAGTRGWLVPSKDMRLKPEDEKIYLRELMRMEMSLEDARRKGGDRPILVMMHYPPFNEKREISGFMELFGAYGVQKVVFGHIHGAAVKNCFCGQIDGISYQLVSADGLDFRLHQIY